MFVSKMISPSIQMGSRRANGPRVLAIWAGLKGMAPTGRNEMLTTLYESQRRRTHTARATQRRTAPSIEIILTGAAIRKILDCLLPHRATPPQSEQAEPHHLRPTLRPWIGIIDQILKYDAQVPRRYRTTVMRILKTLREEHGFPGGVYGNTGICTAGPWRVWTSPES